MNDNDNACNIEAWKKFINLIGERYPDCMNSDKEDDIALCNAIVEVLADACR